MSMSLCVVDLSIVSSRFIVYIDLQMFDSSLLYSIYYYCHHLSILQTSLHITVVTSLVT